MNSLCFKMIFAWGKFSLGKYLIHIKSAMTDKDALTFSENFLPQGIFFREIHTYLNSSIVSNFVAHLAHCPTYLSMIVLWNLLYEFQCLEWILMVEMNFSDYNLEFQCLQCRILVLTIIVPKSKPYELKTSLT